MDRVVLFLVAWFAGFVAYFTALFIGYGEVPRVQQGDFSAVLFWSLLSFAVAYVALYLPAMGLLRRRLGGVRPLWPFPLAAVAIGVIPTALIAFSNGGDLRALASAEAGLFYVMFATIGIVVGAGYVLLQRTARPA